MEPNKQTKLFWIGEVEFPKSIIPYSILNKASDGNSEWFKFKIQIVNSDTKECIGYIRNRDITDNIEEATIYGPSNKAMEKMTIMDALDFFESQFKTGKLFKINDIYNVTFLTVKSDIS